VSVPLDEGKEPRIVFADGTQSIYLADLTGDGLSDILRIRNGEVSYWPNRGYGRFGAKVTMDHSPWFDEPDLFDQRRIRLADTDGSGTTDILYLSRDGVRIFLNETGNGWRSALHLAGFPTIDDLAAISVSDFLGRGTACLLWSSPLPGDAGRQVRYVDLMCGQKPHLLVRTDNNLGAETRIDYASSTAFYPRRQSGGNRRGLHGYRFPSMWSSASKPTTMSAATASLRATRIIMDSMTGSRREVPRYSAESTSSIPRNSPP